MAHAPARWGAAIEVPRKFTKAPPGIDELIHCPGATSVRNDAVFEKSEIRSATVPPLPSSVDPTLTAEEMQAGGLIESP